MFQESINDVSSVLRFFQLSFKGVSSRFQGGFKRISRNFQECFMKITRVFQKSIRSILKKFQDGSVFNSLLQRSFIEVLCCLALIAGTRAEGVLVFII